jgi:hypothetical protein
MTLMLRPELRPAWRCCYCLFVLVMLVIPSHSRRSQLLKNGEQSSLKGSLLDGAAVFRQRDRVLSEGQGEREASEVYYRCRVIDTML